MTYEEFKAKRLPLEERLTTVLEEIESLESELIKSAPFKKDDRVRVENTWFNGVKGINMTDSRFAYVGEVSVSTQKDLEEATTPLFRYLLWAERKDGKPGFTTYNDLTWRPVELAPKPEICEK